VSNDVVVRLELMVRSAKRPVRTLTRNDGRCIVLDLYLYPSPYRSVVDFANDVP